MAVTVAVPAEAMRGRHSFGDDHLGADREAPERGPAQNQIAEMAVLLSNTRGSMILGGSVLSALTIGIALEAAFSPSVLRPGLAGVVTVSLLGCVIVCWLRAAALLLLAGLLSAEKYARGLSKRKLKNLGKPYVAVAYAHHGGACDVSGAFRSRPRRFAMHLPSSVSIDVSGFVTIQRHLGVALTSVGAGDDIDMRLPRVFW